MLEARVISVEIAGRLLIEDVSLRLEPGRLIALVGPNGAGKSTLLKALSGERKCSSGTVTLDGQQLSAISPLRLASRRAVVAQAAHLEFPFSVLEVTMLGATVPGFAVEESAAIERASAAIASAGLTGFEGRLYSSLSGGEKQRVQIARALCQLAMAAQLHKEPLALLLDEPTSSLDLAHQALIATELRHQTANGRAVLVVLHDLNLAASIADETVLLSKGRAVAHGHPSDVLKPDLLSKVYDCEIIAAHVEGRPEPVLLPRIAPQFTLKEAAQ